MVLDTNVAVMILCLLVNCYLFSDGERRMQVDQAEGRSERIHVVPEPSWLVLNGVQSRSETLLAQLTLVLPKSTESKL